MAFLRHNCTYRITYRHNCIPDAHKIAELSFYPPIFKKNMAKSIFQRLQCPLTDFRLQLAFPDNNGMPAHRSQLFHFRHIPAPVLFNFALPIPNVCFRQNIIPASVVPMPEASVHKNDSSVF